MCFFAIVVFAYSSHLLEGLESFLVIILRGKLPLSDRLKPSDTNKGLPICQGRSSPPVFFKACERNARLRFFLQFPSVFLPDMPINENAKNLQKKSI